VDKRRFLPERWCSETYAAGRAQCAVPTETVLPPQPQLAAAMVQAVHAADILPFRSSAADGLYGKSPEGWTACEAGVGPVAFVAMPEETRGWLQPLAPQRHTDKYRGETPTKRVTAAPDIPARTVAQLARELGAPCWYRRTVSEGTKGPLTYALARQRGPLCQAGQPAQTVGFVSQRTRGEEATYGYSMSNAPWSASGRLLVGLSGLRWAVAQGLTETKLERGMDHDECRKYTGWHHHRLTCMLAHFFL
jgi:SRSO17 transposase